MSTDGQVHVLMGTYGGWQVRTSGNSGTTFSDAVEVVEAAPSTFVDMPNLVATSGGEVYLAYRERSPAGWAARVLRSTDGGRHFSEPVNVSRVNNPASAHVFEVTVAALPGGRVAVGYKDDSYVGEAQRFKVAWSSDGGATWREPVLVDTQADGQGVEDSCKVAYAPDGTLYALYYHSEGMSATFTPYLRALRPDGTWSSKVDLRALLPGGSHGIPEALSVDGLGRLHVVLDGETYYLERDATLHFLGTFPAGDDGGPDGDDGTEGKVTDFASFWVVLALMVVFMALAVFGFMRRPKQPQVAPAGATPQEAAQPYNPPAPPQMLPPPQPPPAVPPAPPPPPAPAPPPMPPPQQMPPRPPQP